MSDNSRSGEQLVRELEEVRIRNRDLESRNVRLQAELHALRESQARAESESRQEFRALVQSANSVILRMDTEGRITFFNEYAERFFGYREAELLGKNVVGSIVPSADSWGRDLAAILSDIARNPDRYVTNENENMRRNGERVWMAWTNKGIPDDQGNVTEVLCIGNDVTQRKHAEEELRKSEEKYRTIVESIEEGYYEVDLMGRLVFFNDSVCEITGYAREELRGNSYELFMDEENAKRTFEAYNQVFQTGRPRKIFDYEIVRKDGKKRIVEISISPIRDLHGAATGFRGIVRDVTEIRQAEQDLKFEKDRFRRLAERAPLGIAMIGCNGHYQYLNPKFTEIFGYDEKDIPAVRDWFTLAYPDPRYRRKIVARWEQLATGQDIDRDDPPVYRVRCKDGSEKIIQFRAVRLRSGDYIMTCEDISDLKQAQEWLRDSEERYRSVMEVVPDPVVVYDFQGKVTYVNHAFTRAFGWTLDEFELSGARLNFVPEENRSETAGAFRRMLQGEPILMETRGKTKDGRVLDIQVNSAVLTGRDGKPAGSVVILRDITSRKKSQRELREARDELERRVAERTAELYDAVQALNRENAKRIRVEDDLLASRQMLDNILNASPVGIVYYEKGKLKWINHAMAGMFGPQTYIGRHPSEFYESREEYRRVTKLFFTCLAQGKPAETEAQLIRADGSSFPGLLRLSALDVRDPKKANIATIVDLTEKKLAEQKQRESEERYRTLVEESFDGIMIQDGTRIVFANTRLHKMLGYPEGGLLGMEFWRTFHPDYHDVLRRRSLARLSGQDVPSQYEVQLYRKDGSSFDGELNVRVLREGEKTLIQVWIRDISQRKKAERELQEGRQMLTTILAASPVGIARASGRRIDWVNKAFAEMFGFEHESQCLGQSTQIIYVSRQEFKQAGKMLYSDLARQRQAEIDSTFIRRDGTTFQGHITIAPTDSSNPTGEVIAVIMDISERKRAEKALQQSEETARALLNATMEAALLTDMTGRILASNEVAASLFRMPANRLVGHNYIDFLPVDLVESRSRRNNEVIETGAPTRFVDIQNERYLDNCIYPVFNDAGQVERLAIFARDITEQKQAEEALKDSEEKYRRLYEETRRREELYRSLLNSSPDAVVIYDMDARAQYVNPSFTDIFGWKQRDVRGKAIEYVPQTELEETQRVIQEKILQGVPVSGWETRRFTKDGRILHVSVSGSRYHDHEDKPAGILMILRDITERKEAEKELELALETSRQLREQAEAANKAKSDFVANMSHEIRTPMNAIMGLTDLSLRSDVSSKVRDYLTKIRISSQNLLGIINDILDFSKIEAGKLDLESVGFDLRDVMGNLADLMGATASNKGVEFLVSLASDVPCGLEGDPLRLGQVLTNLANNAVKFTHQGEIIVEASLVEKDEERATIEFAVKDTGIGIEPQLIPMLFDSFTQADGSTTRRFGGSGLGLTICKRLVEMMGGKIRVESEPGKGSLFSFRLRFERLPDKDTGRFVVSPDMSGLKVLVVDDNAMAREILVEMISSFTFKAKAVASGFDAVRELETEARTRPYDLVLMDWNMPGMNGIETSRKIDTDFRQGISIPKIIMVTAHGREEVMAQAEEAGMAAFLVKPIHQSVLFDTITEVFGRQPGKMPVGLPKGESELKPRTHLQGARVLVVEDNEINQQVAREILVRVGAIVEIASNGRQAVQAVAERHFDAVLMDVQMPEMDGYEATRHIRSDERFKDLPIIAMTAHAMKGDRERCLKAGMNDHVTKPVDIDELRHTLTQWVKPGLREIIQSEGPPRAGEVEPSMLPARLPGIDVLAALQRLGGDERLLLHLLDSFAQQFHDACSCIREAREKGEPEVAQRLAHTIKGVAGNIGADELQDVAGNLDRALRDDNGDETLHILMQFDQALATLMQSISLITHRISEPPAAEPAPHKGPVTDLEPVKPVLKELADLIAEHNVRALQCLDSHKTDLQEAGIGDEIRLLEDSLSLFDFRKARSVLTEILRIGNISVEGE